MSSTITASPGTTASTDAKNVQDLTVFVENLLSSMQEKFQAMSDQILSRMDEMGGRIDELEKNIDSLMQQAGIEDDGHIDK